MSALIENYFLQPLEAHYETKARAGVRGTIIAALSGEAEDTLSAAVEHLKRNRKAMTFPSPSECEAACRASRAVTGRVVDGITGKNYARKAAEYAKSAKKSEFPIIQKWTSDERSHFTPQWKAWQEYWERIGAIHTLALVYDRESWTVPTNWPHEFDPNADYSSGDADTVERRPAYREAPTPYVSRM